MCNLHGLHTVIGLVQIYILIHTLDRKKIGKRDTAVKKAKSFVYSVDVIQVKFYGEMKSNTKKNTFS